MSLAAGHKHVHKRRPGGWDVLEVAVQGRVRPSFGAGPGVIYAPLYCSCALYDPEDFPLAC